MGPQERVQQRTVEQIGNVPVLQIQEQVEEVVIVIPQERFSWCASPEIHHKREYHFVWSRKSHLLFPRQHACPGFSWHDILEGQSLGGCSSGLESMLGHIANVVEKSWGRSMTATFGLQNAHVDGADEIDALLGDVPSAGLKGVDRVIGASLIVKVVKTRKCRLRHMLATVAGILKEHRIGGAERAMALTNFGEEADDTGKGGGRGKRGQASNPGARKRTMEEAGSFFSRIVEKLEERSSLARRAVRAARAAFHSHPWSQRAMWSSPRSRARFNRACVRRALASLSNDCDVVPPAWRCESCRQTTLVDGVVPRSARRGFGEPHFSVKF